jgi:hypothetical protein
MAKIRIIIAAAVLAFCCRGAYAQPEAPHQAWAPVIQQCAASRADFITAADFDGDWIGGNNWENMDKFPLPAVVYYDVKETHTHWFLFYTLFHPRDYTPDPECPVSCHENDAESLQLVVRKDGSGRGALELMETLAHSSIMLYANNPAVRGGTLKVTGPVTLTNGRPTVFVEQYGHGIYGTARENVMANPAACRVVRYLPLGRSEEPAGIPSAKTSYALVPLYDTLWRQRGCMGDGRCFDGAFTYRGAVLPSSFDGDDFGTDSANTPWGYGQALEGGLVSGDWFFDPARAIAVHAGPLDNFSQTYVVNPYMADLEAAAAGAAPQ